MAKTKGGGTDPPQDRHNAKVLQKRQLLAQVVRRTGLRSADIKPVVEATLAELGNAIAAGMTLALPPLGRARVRHSIDRSGAEIVTLRLRRRPDAEPLGDG
ncbi:HU family DNA-binding protein [Paracoccus sp. (in: a-proteobacteria)]|uniref:HU family DNA-binding protein n=1 Tax=Paracoccus sp. TaxID=267 RepID=UPI0035B3A1F6